MIVVADNGGGSARFAPGIRGGRWLGTAHEWQTWRRSFHEFAPLLFKN